MDEKNKERQDRLAAALRENLRRRKGQSRQLASGSGSGEPDRER